MWCITIHKQCTEHSKISQIHSFLYGSWPKVLSTFWPVLLDWESSDFLKVSTIFFSVYLSTVSKFLIPIFVSPKYTKNEILKSDILWIFFCPLSYLDVKNSQQSSTLFPFFHCTKKSLQKFSIIISTTLYHLVEFIWKYRISRFEYKSNVWFSFKNLSEIENLYVSRVEKRKFGQICKKRNFAM